MLVSMAASAYEVRVVDQNGNPLADIVVTDAKGLTREPTTTPPQGAAPKVSINQIDKQFVPNVLVIQRGTQVDFPNNDTVLHHIYSFSKAKSFEVPLYKGALPSPIKFDEPGLVVLGCNIHDQMIGHILVVDSENFAHSDNDGRVSLEGTPESIALWQPGQPIKVVSTQRGTVTQVEFHSQNQRQRSASLTWNDY